MSPADKQRIKYAFNQPRLEHIAIWAEDLDKSAAFLEEALGWKRHPLVFGVPEENPVFGGMELAFVDANGLWIELVQPTTEGPGQEFLKLKGNGAIVELDFEIDDFNVNTEAYKQRGINLIGMDGEPLRAEGLLQEWVLVDGKRVPADEHLSYLPFDLARGTSIELFTEEANGALLVRDNDYPDAPRTPASAPRLDNVMVLAEDFEQSLKVYTEILTLPRHSSSAGLRRDWLGFEAQSHAWIEANKSGFWIELVGTRGGTKGGLGKHADGTIVEMGVEVPDIDAFSRRMAAKGIVMTAGDSVSLPAGQSSVADPRTGDRYCYFPLNKSHGMRIMVFQRGGSESVFAKRA
jgi:catechol 2,3-dioxygenase-like lactoylglutathione lyase family enzyme